MAEEDIALAVIKTKAEGIEIIDVIDKKYTSLGSTMQKGQKRAEGTKEALEELNQQLNKNSKSTADASVKNIESLMIMEAATSGINQLISARYKDSDAQLASGEITQEEAEELRKSVKQQEKYSSSLEKTIAIMRLYKVAQFAGAAAVNLATAATNINTVAVKANTKALLKNPWVVVAVVLLAVLAYTAKLNRDIGFMADQFDFLNKKLKPVNDSFERFIEGIETITGFDIQNNRLWEAFLTD